MKNARPKINIDCLREIGWTLWDPISLNETMGGWKGEAFEDEYDSYLLKAAGMLWNKRTAEEVVEYLFQIESQHMGLGPDKITPKMRERLLAVVNAIKGDHGVWSNGRQ
ncbi:hypothetical protein ROA7450_04081 [Roseovarius albus]|uniref:Uncharacterized protein n=1 Tax=Roseovarius albus TaxID=1247867 RepID=A0A1X7A8L9_9RHOB|nr:hypothetical protein [Roseovarius albus]SLN72937.1 hypothetical protein ROA7450_04081 [Roseovarius albus]